jgi:hypothetical protein
VIIAGLRRLFQQPDRAAMHNGLSFWLNVILPPIFY